MVKIFSHTKLLVLLSIFWVMTSSDLWAQYEEEPEVGDRDPVSDYGETVPEDNIVEIEGPITPDPLDDEHDKPAAISVGKEKEMEGSCGRSCDDPEDPTKTQVINIQEWAAGEQQVLDMMWFVDSGMSQAPKNQVKKEVEYIIGHLGGSDYNLDLKIGFYGSPQDFDPSWREKMKKLMAKYFGDESLFQVFDVNPGTGGILEVPSTRLLHHALLWLGTVPKGKVDETKYEHATGLTFFRDSDSEKSHKIFTFVTHENSKKYPKKRGGGFGLGWVLALVAGIATGGMGFLAVGAVMSSVGAAGMLLGRKSSEAYAELKDLKKTDPHPKHMEFLDQLEVRFGFKKDEDDKQDFYSKIDTWAFVAGGGRGGNGSSGCTIEKDDDDLSTVEFEKSQGVKVRYEVSQWDITGANEAENGDALMKCRSLRKHDQGTGGKSCVTGDSGDRLKLKSYFRSKTDCSVMCEVNRKDVLSSLSKEKDREEYLKKVDSTSGKKCEIERHAHTDRQKKIGQPATLDILMFDGKMYKDKHFSLGSGICGAKSSSGSIEESDRCTAEPSEYLKWAKALGSKTPPVCFSICGVAGTEKAAVTSTLLGIAKLTGTATVSNCSIERTGEEYLSLKDITGGISADVCGTEWRSSYEAHQGLGQFQSTVGITRIRNKLKLNHSIKEVKSITLVYHKSTGKRPVRFTKEKNKAKKLLGEIIIKGKTLDLNLQSMVDTEKCEKSSKAESEIWKDFAEALALEGCANKVKPVSIKIVYVPRS